MKNVLKVLGFLFLFVGMGMSTSQAQAYKTSVGLRGGYGLGVTGKMYLSENNAAEVVARLAYGLTSITGLYLIHKDIESVENLRWYYGPGVNAAFNRYGSGFGIAAAVGAEYVFDDIPLNISIDWIPTFNFGHFNGFGYYGGGVAVRYIL